MARIRLGEDDAKRFDRADWMPFDGDRITIGEAILLEEQLGISDGQWQRMLTGELLLDERGAPILKDNKPLRRFSARTWKVVVWLTLRRSGVELAYDDVDTIDLRAFEVRADDEDDESGKDPDPDSGT